MSRPPLEVADIFRVHGQEYRNKNSGRICTIQYRAMRAIENCRTSVLGGHVKECDECGHRSAISYNSCRNRNCPKCQSSAAARWLEKRETELLPVNYFHIVFTVPECVAQIAIGNQRVVYGLLFRAVSETLLKIGLEAKHLGATLGFLCILHTWGQNLHYHPHIHCVVAAGGLTADKRWICSRKKFFLPIAVLSKMFRGKLLALLKSAFLISELTFTGKLKELSSQQRFYEFLKPMYSVGWVVYCKPPFGGPAQTLKYLGRYTHRIAISNQRLISLNNGEVKFRWKDYRDKSRIKVMALPAEEFIRRFLMHVVPAGFVRIRHYGFMSNRKKVESLSLIRSALNVSNTTESVSETCILSGIDTTERSSCLQ
jgi:hypothetical protein